MKDLRSRLKPSQETFAGLLSTAVQSLTLASPEAQTICYVYPDGRVIVAQLHSHSPRLIGASHAAP
ncbi:hypothetical protein XM38_042670 [Halomicronema hongdechloris C2206]|uniref:Uncharacterized protein n=1 Tax=Halomicronema hongdechloris C2206 TaxID=1641165 RepID=A0A1Z3HSL6_9CYAN|nr:hypothetical protein XM38_042670 [Halomicronema hongdechloris C2206]